MNIELEIAKTQASLQNLITCVKFSEEGKCDVDILGSLLAIADQLDKVDEAIETLM